MGFVGHPQDLRPQSLGHVASQVSHLEGAGLQVSLNSSSLQWGGGGSDSGDPRLGRRRPESRSLPKTSPATSAVGILSKQSFKNIIVTLSITVMIYIALPVCEHCFKHFSYKLFNPRNNTMTYAIFISIKVKLVMKRP